MAEQHQPTELSWRLHLAKEQPGRAAVALGVIAFFVLLVGCMMQNLFWPALAFLLLLGSLHDFFFPTRYAVTEGGVKSTGFGSQHELQWSRARRYFVCDDGVKISPLAGPSKLEDYRGVFLRCRGETREQVLAVVRARLGEPANPPLDELASFCGDVV